MEEKIAFFEERGLRVERVPFYTENTHLNILYGFDADGQARMKQLMHSFYIWKMTAIAETVEIKAQTANVLDIQYQQKGDVLQVSLTKMVMAFMVQNALFITSHSMTSLAMHLTMQEINVL